MDVQFNGLNWIDIEMESMKLTNEKQSVLANNIEGNERTMEEVNKHVMEEENKQTMEEENKPKLRRSSRVMKPILYSEGEAEEPQNTKQNFDVKSYYLDKSVKKLPATLETIFEEPKKQKNKNMFMSNRKYKRVCDFENQAKIRKRQMKIKKHFKSKYTLKKKNITIAALKKKLDEVDDDS